MKLYYYFMNHWLVNGHCVCRNIKFKRITANDQPACIWFFFFFFVCSNKINTFISSFQVLFWFVCVFISDIYSEVLWIHNCMHNAHYPTGTYSALQVHRIITIYNIMRWCNGVYVRTRDFGLIFPKNAIIEFSKGKKFWIRSYIFFIFSVFLVPQLLLSLETLLRWLDCKWFQVYGLQFI